ncbi:MAG TPA: DUF937 domain-containing protein [Verrucomicrobiales bacterium]|nr:DUF937 domain-containing protein [Verrucomicrobiales bacterium]
MNILDDLQNEHGSDIRQHLVNQLGLSDQQAASVLPKVGPLILGALKQRMDSHGEEHVLGHAQQLGATDFSDIGTILNGGAQSNDADLGGLLNGKGTQATEMMANHLGISPGTAAKIIPMLAPLIIGMLMKRSGAATGNPGAAGGSTGGLGSILDRDGDGHILDDLGGLFTAGVSGATRSGCLSSLLGGILKRRG